MKAKFIFFSMGLIFSVETIAQGNLIGNGSFEENNCCPGNLGYAIDLGQVQGCSNPGNYTPDYFHSCSTQPGYGASVPSNFRGFQQARTGNGYVGIGLFSLNYLISEYIQMRLKETLKLGHANKLEIYLSRAELARYATSDFGVYFSADSVFMPGADILPFIPQIINQPGNYFTDTIGWSYFTGNYVSQGGERYILIGNFNSGLQDTISLHDGPPNSDGAYYCLDDVSLIDLDSALSMEENQSTLHSLQVYPNPAKGQITVTNTGNYKDLLVEDMQSRLLSRHSFGSGNLTLDVSNLPAGMYLLRAIGSEGTARRRLIVEY